MKAATWFARVAFAAVFVLNVQCALQFCLNPGGFAAAYELGGVAGEAAIRGIGIAFLMWNATYPAFIVFPDRFRALGVVVLLQQFIGLVGELLLSLSLPGGHAILQGSISRFALFDGLGLILMLATFIWMMIELRKASPRKAKGE